MRSSASEPALSSLDFPSSGFRKRKLSKNRAMDDIGIRQLSPSSLCHNLSAGGHGFGRSASLNIDSLPSTSVPYQERYALLNRMNGLGSTRRRNGGETSGLVKLETEPKDLMPSAAKSKLAPDGSQVVAGPQKRKLGNSKKRKLTVDSDTSGSHPSALAGASVMLDSIAESQESIAEQNKQMALDLLQKQRLMRFLKHTLVCTAHDPEETYEKGSVMYEDCLSMRELLNHIKSCKTARGKICPVENCYEVQCLLLHKSSCNDFVCPLCNSEAWKRHMGIRKRRKKRADPRKLSRGSSSTFSKKTIRRPVVNIENGPTAKVALAIPTDSYLDDDGPLMF